jgi:hypothetical protein
MAKDGQDAEPTVVMEESAEGHLISFVGKHKSSTIIVLVVIAACAVILFAYILYSKHKNNNSVLAVCTTSQNISLLRQSEANIQTNNMLALQKQVEDIKALNNYQQDPNCLYPILSYYIGVGDSTNSSLYLTGRRRRRRS